MLRLTGELGDGWIPSLGRMTLEELAAGQEVIDAAAEEAGRDPAAIRRMVNIGASLASTGASTKDAAHAETADAWTERLVELCTTYGVDTFVLWLSDPVASRSRASPVRSSHGSGRESIVGDPEPDCRDGRVTSPRSQRLLAPCLPSAVLVDFGRLAIVRFLRAASCAFLMFFRAAARCFSVAMATSFVIDS
jgi:hypothetical protein